MLLDTLILPDIACRMLGHDAVLEHICNIVALRLTAGRTVVFVIGTKGMVLVNHIIELQLWRPSVPGVSDFLSGVTGYKVGTNVVS